MFTFNFLPDGGDEPAKDVGAPIESAAPFAGKTTVAKSSENSASSAAAEGAVTHPFVWKKDLESFLESRANQEIVYQEVDLSLPNGGTEEEDDDNDDEEEEAAEEEPLRRVCMEQYEKEVTPGVYEGGLQVWECSLDLVRYFEKNNIGLSEGSSALELGCGHGLPGCWLLREALQKHFPTSITIAQPSTTTSSTKPPFTVVFVDYNDYVIDDVLLSNVILNTGQTLKGDAKQLAQQNLIQVGSGDWKDMSRQFLSDRRQFDCIVAAETTYTPQAAFDTAELLLHHLTPNTGIGWVASKRYYFGVGGGTESLRDAAKSLAKTGDHPYRLKVETVSVLDSGVGNIREILKVTCLPNVSE